MNADLILAGLAASEPVRVARAGVADPADLWIVGGAIRDAALGGAVTDLDLATSRDPGEIAREIAAAPAAAVFELSGEHGTWRVASHRGGWSIDIASLRGATIEADLRLRDFTVNAIAGPIPGGQLLDPTGGLTDLDSTILRACGPTSFADDPLRIMRAARLAAGLGLKIDPATRRLAIEAAGRAAEPAGERQFAELRGILAGPDPIEGLRLLEELGAGARVLPELVALRGVVQNANHHLDVHDHTIEVLRRLLEVEADLERFAGDAAAGVRVLLDQPVGDGMTRREGMRFAAILHDVGKPATRNEAAGMVSFKGHDRVGAEMLAEICRRFKTSRKSGAYLTQLTRDHLILGFMVRERPLPRRRVWEYLRATDPWSVDVTLLTIADRLSARGLGVPEQAIEGHLGLAEEMLAEALAWELDGPPEPLLRGDALADALGIEPGEELGRMMREQEAVLFAGEASDREELLSRLAGLS